ncbi:MAG: hypothetical protein KAU14_07145, partial [Thermoplasmata archaeon]|nr:hypothetical protein [Thermoplasmata archaeon]
MKRNKLSALFVLLVALLFLLPSAAALGSTSGESGDTEPEAENSVPLGEEMETEYSEAGEDPEIPDPVNELTENSYLVPYGQQITHPVKPVGPGNGPDTSVETKSSVMVISKIGLHDEDGFPVDELDDGEEGKVSAEVTNEGGKEDVMTDVEVDFYYIDKDEDTYYIDGANIEYIEGDGNSSTAMVNWTTDMLARTIKVIADADGSDGGPSEGYQDVNITQANYAQKIYCPYPAGSGEAGDTLNYWIKVDNIGEKTDDVKLEVEGAGVWSVKFDNGQSTKTIYNMKSEEHKWEKVSVTIPNGAGGDAYKDITIKATSQSNTNKVRTFDLRTTVLRSDTPILILDRDHGSQPQPYWNDASRYWAQALDDGGYTGMHYRTTSSVSDTKDYDIIMLSAGYDWQYGLTSTDETNLIAFLKDGGSVWIGGGLFMQASDEPSYGKTCVHPLYYNYMNVSWQAQNRHPPRPLIGVAGDPIGKGMVYSMNYVWTVGQDWGESVWPYTNDTWSAGIYHHGDVYAGMRHHWQGSTPDKPEEYRSVYTGIDLCQVGDEFPMSSSGYWGDPDRTDVMYNIATWLGVAPPLPKANDLALEKIIDPAGDYIYPGDDMTINVEVANYGIKDYETSYTVTVDIEQTNGAYTKTLTKPMDASDNPIPARGWAYPGAQIVSLDWTVPTEEDAEYKFTAKVGSDDNNDNNEKVATATAKKVEDMRTNKCEWEWRTHYWLTAVKDTPIRFDLEVENIGARESTFDAYVNILDPWESGILAKLEKEVKVGAGHTKTVHFVWTPDKAAGCRDATQSWRVSYTDDGPPYWIDVGVDYKDDDTSNNEIEHDKADYGGQVGDITVVDWYESGEAGAHGWDLGDPWHWTPMFTQGGEYGAWHGNKSSVIEGTPHYDDNTRGIMTSPVLDWGQYSAVRSDYLYVVQMRNPDYVSIQIKKEDEPDYWKDAPHNHYANYSMDRGSGGYLNNGNNYNDYASHKTQI